MLSSVALHSPPRSDSLEDVLGRDAWRRLPLEVRERFGHPQRKVDYVGEFDIVRASALGLALAWLCRLIGTPLAPYTGKRIPAIVHVVPVRTGVAWRREYRWPWGCACEISSTKTIEPDGSLVEKLPAGLCMALDVFEREGSLHFKSSGYYFEWPLLLPGKRIPLPRWLSPGCTHVEHRNEADGWFRFILTVTHPFFGELIFQSGRFHAAGAST